MLDKFKLSQKSLAILYKLLSDSLFILAIFLLAALFLEALIPGISAAHFAFAKIIILVCINLAGLHMISGKIGPEFISDKTDGTKIKPAIILLPAIIILGVLNFWRLDIALGFFVIAMALVAGIFAYKTLTQD